MLKNKPTKWGETLLLLLGLLLFWQLVATSGIWSSYILPSPGKVSAALISMIRGGELVANVLISAQRVVLGVLTSISVALLLEIGAFCSSRLQRLTGKIVRFLQNVPPLSLIPLLILWFGIGESTKVIFIALGCFPPIFISFDKGLRACDKALLEVGHCYHFSRREMLTRIILPSAKYDILTGIRIGLSYGWKSVVGAEMIAATSGLGYMIQDAQYMARTDKLFAGILVIGTIGFMVDGLLSRLILRYAYGGGEALV